MSVRFNNLDIASYITSNSKIIISIWLPTNFSVTAIFYISLTEITWYFYMWLYQLTVDITTYSLQSLYISSLPPSHLDILHVFFCYFSERPNTIRYFYIINSVRCTIMPDGTIYSKKPNIFYIYHALYCKIFSLASYCDTF